MFCSICKLKNDWSMGVITVVIVNKKLKALHPQLVCGLQWLKFPFGPFKIINEKSKIRVRNDIILKIEASYSNCQENISKHHYL